MQIIKIINENLDLKTTTFNTFEDFIETVEDLKFWQIINNNSKESFDINILEKKYLW